MYKYFLLISILLFSLNVNSNENLLTIKQQLERLQREVTDLSQTVFSDKTNISSKENKDVVTNLSAIDMRIYDLEKDVKSLTGNLEEVFFKLEDILLKINNFQEVVLSIEDKIAQIKKIDETSAINQEAVTETSNSSDDNTLGSLKITTENNDNLVSNEVLEENDEKKLDIQDEKKDMSPEDQFQIAFDNIRSKNWDEAKVLLLKFIENNSENQLTGSAHYWLGELYVLEKQHRDAALIFTEGYQKFPNSIKAPDMLFKLSQSLFEVEKFNESCKTLEKFIIDYPKNKFIKNAKKQIQNYGCLDANE